MPITILDAVRTVGHLLEHHGDTSPKSVERYAADKHDRAVEPTDPQACKFCAYGACTAVAKALGLNSGEIQSALRIATGRFALSAAWDLQPDSARRSFYTALQNVK